MPYSALPIPPNLSAGLPVIKGPRTQHQAGPRGRKGTGLPDSRAVCSKKRCCPRPEATMVHGQCHESKGLRPPWAAHLGRERKAPTNPGCCHLTGTQCLACLTWQPARSQQSHSRPGMGNERQPLPWATASLSQQEVTESLCPGQA